MNRLLASLPPIRWWRASRALFVRARVHPQAVLLGRTDQIELGRGCKLGARVRVDPGSQGHVTIGEQVWIATDVEIQTDGDLRIGASTSIQRRSTINGSTRLGGGCILAPNVFISSGTHPFRHVAHLPIREQERRLDGDGVSKAKLDRPVWVQDDCWLGANVVVCPGVTIGKGSVIGANAVVTHDVHPYSIVAGIPARVIGKRLNWCPPLRLDPAREEHYPYLLGACLRDENGVSCIEISVDAPLHAALAAPISAAHVALDWRASTSVVIEVGCRHIELMPGHGTLVLSTMEMRIDGGVLYCTISVPSGIHASSRLVVTGLQVVSG